MKRNFTVRHGALDGVETFLSVARHRNFRRAAAELRVTPSAISQAVRTLETRVGAALFIRTTRSVGLTEAGERFLSRARPAFEELVAASKIAGDLGRRPSGLLRLAVPPSVMPILLQPHLPSFCQAYPDIEVEIVASGMQVDLATGGFDAGIRLGQFIAADMVAVRLTPPFKLIIVGSPTYFAGRALPQRPDDLRHHACLRLRRSDGSLASWPLHDKDRTIEIAAAGPLIANEFPTLLGAAVEGVGLAQVPEPIAAEAVKAGKLVSVLDAFAPDAPGMFLYYADRRQMTPKLRAFVDHVKRRTLAPDEHADSSARGEKPPRRKAKTA